MDIVIEYCVIWDYLPKASRAEEEIKSVYRDAKVTLKPGERGAFEVSLNGKLIFSKLYRVATFRERFPEPRELVKLIKKDIG